MGRTHRAWWKTALGLVFTAIMLFPLYWMVNVSLTQRSAIRRRRPLPRHFTLDHYRVVAAPPAALPRHQPRRRARHRRAHPGDRRAGRLRAGAPARARPSGLRFLLIVAQMVPAVVMALGFYQIYTTLGILDTVPGLILPTPPSRSRSA